MKQLIRNLLRQLGYDIVKYNWPLGGTVVGNDIFVSTKTGDYYLPRDARNDVIARAIVNNDIFEKEIVDVAIQYIKKDSVVIDVGANYGQMSMVFAKLVGKEGKVIAIEAQHRVYDLLTKTIIVNGFRNIRALYRAAFNTSNRLLFFMNPDLAKCGTYGSYGIELNTRKGVGVFSVAIDDLDLQEPISFMKIDAQGCDLPAMIGARKTIEKNKMPIIFEYEEVFARKLQTSFQDYVDFVESINYRFEKVINWNYLILPK